MHIVMLSRLGMCILPVLLSMAELRWNSRIKGMANEKMRK